MKKTRLKTLTTIVLGASLLFGGSALAQNVGEAMPSLEGTQVAKMPQYGQEMSKKWVMTHVHKFGKCYANVVYAICGDKVSKNPVGIFKLDTNKLYLDNAPNDGIIDSVITENYPRVPDTVPFCKHAS